MRAYPRARRVAALIQEELSTTLIKKIKDPRLTETTVTGVKVTDDLKTARIYYCTSSRPGAREDAALGFKKASGFLRRELGAALELRVVPALEFFYDESLEYGQRMDALIASLKTEKTEEEA